MNAVATQPNNLEQILMNNLQDFSDFIRSSKEFVVSQSPATIQEFLSFYRVEHYVGLIVWVVFAVIAIGVSIYCNKLRSSCIKTNKEVNQYDKNYTNPEAISCLWIFSIICITFGIASLIAGITIHLTPILQSYLSPRIIIIQEFSRVIKGH